MKVLITGGTGFIGSRLALKCLERGDTVKVLGQDNNQAEAENKVLLESKGVEVTLASITEKNILEQSLQGIDVVFHLAAAQHEANVPDQRFWDVNVAGTRYMLNASLQCGVKRFVHGSTIGVYGAALEGHLNENSMLRPDNIYGITKLEGEKLVLSYKEKLPLVIIRISETYGPGDRRLLKLFKAIKKHVFFMIGDGTNLHHLIFIEDLIEGMIMAAQSEAALGKVFVLSGKEPLSTNEMVAIIARQLGGTVPQWRAPLWIFLLAARVCEGLLRPLGIQPPLHPRRMDFFRKGFVFSQEIPRKVLGFAPKVSFERGALETTKWYGQMGLL